MDRRIHLHNTYQQVGLVHLAETAITCTDHELEAISEWLSLPDVEGVLDGPALRRAKQLNAAIVSGEFDAFLRYKRPVSKRAIRRVVKRPLIVDYIADRLSRRKRKRKVFDNHPIFKGVVIAFALICVALILGSTLLAGDVLDPEVKAKLLQDVMKMLNLIFKDFL